MYQLILYEAQLKKKKKQVQTLLRVVEEKMDFEGIKGDRKRGEGKMVERPKQWTIVMTG